jgi:two-component system sensor histidine kinase UhpB
MDHEPVQPAWVVPAALVVATAIGQLLTVDPWTDTFLAQIAWWPGAILMCGLLVSRKQHWALCCAGALLGSALVCASMGRDLLPYCVRLAGEFALVAVATMALQSRRSVLHPHVPGHDARECNPARFVVVAGIVLPVLGAAWCVAASRQFDIPSPRADWVQMALGRSLAYLLLVPAFVALVRLTHGREHATSRVPSLLAALGVFALVGAWMSALGRGEVAPLLLVAPIVLLIWTNHAIGGAWSWIVWSIVCTACLWLSTLGTGPLVHESERATVIHLQWWAVGTSVVLLLLTTLREQRGIARDALRDSYERLGQLARRVMTMQENERSRIARDLHDDVNQSLASLSIELSGLKRHADASSRERIEAMQEHLLGVSDDIRRLSHELHPSMLRYTSLAASLEALCASHSRDELEVHCETEETFSLSEQQKLELFRIAQEALHNAEKHAAASRVHIALRRDGDGALLRIEDDGCGLPEDYASARRGGLGMISMAERVKTLRGQLQFASAAQGGTRVEVRFPVGGPVR